MTAVMVVVVSTVYGERHRQQASAYADPDRADQQQGEHEAPQRALSLHVILQSLFSSTPEAQPAGGGGGGPGNTTSGGAGVPTGGSAGAAITGFTGIQTQ